MEVKSRADQARADAEQDTIYGRPYPHVDTHVYVGGRSEFKKEITPTYMWVALRFLKITTPTYHPRTCGWRFEKRTP